MPKEVFLAKKVDLASGTWDTAIDSANAWLPVPVGKENLKQFVFLWTGQKYIFACTPRAMLILLSSVIKQMKYMWVV